MKVADGLTEEYDYKKDENFGPRAHLKFTGLWLPLTWSTDSKVSSSGFTGSRTLDRTSTLEKLGVGVEDGTILKVLECFRPVPYHKFCTRICDSEGDQPFDPLTIDTDLLVETRFSSTEV